MNTFYWKTYECHAHLSLTDLDDEELQRVRIERAILQPMENNDV